MLNVFGYEGELVFPIFISKQKFEDSMDLLLIYEDNKSHYVYIKDFKKQKIKIKHGFVRVVYNVLVVRMC